MYLFTFIVLLETFKLDIFYPMRNNLFEFNNFDSAAARLTLGFEYCRNEAGCTVCSKGGAVNKCMEDDFAKLQVVMKLQSEQIERLRLSNAKLLNHLASGQMELRLVLV